MSERLMHICAAIAVTLAQEGVKVALTFVSCASVTVTIRLKLPVVFVVPLMTPYGDIATPAGAPVPL